MPCINGFVDDVDVDIYTVVQSNEDYLLDSVCRQLEFSFGGRSLEFTSYNQSDEINIIAGSLAVDQKEVDISGRQVRDIPHMLETYSGLESLDLSRNFISLNLPAKQSGCTLTEEISSSFDKYEDSDFGENYEPAGVESTAVLCHDVFNFGKLNDLTRLNISYNKLLLWPPGLHLLPHLSHLDLSHNLITTLPDQVASSRTLKYLDLSHNCLVIDSTPGWLGQLVKCRSLYLGHNPLPHLHFPPQFSNTTRKLRYLYLSNMSLTEFPTELTSLLDLRHLIISNIFRTSHDNYLARLPSTIADLVGLVKLEVIGVGLCDLPDSIGSMRNLEILDVSHNNISWFPDSLVQLSSLRVLSASNNNLMILPLDFENLTNLQHIMLANNSLAELPENIFTLPSLITFDVYHNQITALPNHLMDSPSLLRCDMASNYIITTEEPKYMMIRYKEMQENIRIWDGSLGDWGCKELVNVDTSKFSERIMDGRQDIKENDIVAADDDIDDICHYCLSGCNCEYYNEINSKESSDEDSDVTKDEIIDDHTTMVEDDPINEEDWDIIDAFSPTKFGIRYNLDHMDLDQFWGKGQFCPADLHNTPMGDQLGKRWEKIMMLKTSQHVGRKKIWMKEDCSENQMPNQFDDADLM